MHSSTSNSEGAATAPARLDPRVYRRGIAVALAALVALLAGLEMFARLVFPQVSQLEHRKAAELAAATAIRPSPPGQPPTILLLGNSLLLEGVDYPELRQDMEREARVRRFVVENTSYLDWYFGIKRLLADGARPEYLVLCLNPAQLVVSSIRSDYSTHDLLTLRDIPELRRRLHYDLTQTSAVVFAQVSLFYARRNSLRSYLLNRFDSPYTELVHSIVTTAPAMPPKAELARRAGKRLKEITAMAASQGVRFSLLLPPGFMSGEAEVLAAAEQTHTKVMVPIHTNDLPRRFFADGFHLNRAGAEIFTAGVRAELKGWMSPTQTARAR